ncbi:MAG TPA: discoidin domain-containing protein [Thermoanaerobaculia bacterium]
MQLLGLGYSLATAPLNQYTAKFPRVIQNDVFQRAQEIARAGQRIFATRVSPEVDNAVEDRDAMIHLSLDLLGNVERVDHQAIAPELFEWDQLRRQEKSGRRAGAAMARELERVALNGRTPQQFMNDFATATSHRTPFLFAYAHGADVPGKTRPYAMSVWGATTEENLDVPAEATTGWVRMLPYSELTQFNTPTDRGELALVGRWTQNMRVVVVPQSSSFTLHLIYPDTQSGSQLRTDVEITSATPGQPVSVEVIRGSRTLIVRGASGSPQVHEVAQTPLRVLGAAQDLHLNEHARLVSFLFNRPLGIADVDKLRDQFALTINVPKANYSITRKNTPDPPNTPDDQKKPLQIPSAALQQDARLINVTFDKALSTNANYVVAVEGIADMIAGGSFSKNDIVPRIDNNAPGGILTGKVLLGDNSIVTGAEVVLSVNGQSGQIEVTDAQGRYMFEFVPRDIDRGMYGHYDLTATANRRATTATGAVRLVGEVHTVNLVFLGRGTAKGQVRYHDGEVIPDVDVTIGSVMFNQFRRGRTDQYGRYEIGDLPVGPLTFSVVDKDGRPTFAANQLRASGEVIEQDLVIERRGFPGTGTVRVTVRRSDNNNVVPHARVGVYTQGYGLNEGEADAQGFIEFNDVPAGLISIIAADFGISNESPGIEMEMRADQTVEQTIIIPIPVPGPSGFAFVEGTITRDDPTDPANSAKFVPVPGAIITVGKLPPITANTDGTYTFPDLPLNASDKPMWVFDPATGRKGQFTLPTLSPGANHFSAHLSSRDPEGYATIRVRLTSATGAPVNGYRVIEPGFPPTSFVAKGEGIYELSGLRVPTSVQIAALPTGGTAAVYGEQMAFGSARADFNGQIAIADIRLPGQGTVVTRIELRQPDEACSVVPCYTQAFGRVALGYSVWDETEQGTAPKTVILEADQTTLLNTFVKIPAQQQIVVYTDRHPAGYAGTDLRLLYEGDLRNVTLRLDTLGDVTGRVYAHDGQTPIANALVELKNNRVVYGKKLTASDGSFRFPAVMAGLEFQVVAQYVQDGIFRTGFADGRTPPGGGPVSNLRVIMREQSSIEGQVVDRDGHPVPLAYYWARELAWPYTEFGTVLQPLQADINGRFIINNVFTGPFRVSAKDPVVQEKRGDYQGTLAFEGDTSQLAVKVSIGDEGTGTIAVTVVDSLQAFKLMPNAEVKLYRGSIAFDLGTTDEQGVVFFRDVPAGSYTLGAYSKSAGRAGRTGAFTVTASQTTSQQVVLDFLGKVAGFVTDPESTPANGAVRGMPVQLDSFQFSTRDSTDSSGNFTILGVPEGTFKIFAYDYDTGRMAFGPTGLYIDKVVQERTGLHLELERTARLTVKAHLPNDDGSAGELAPLAAILVEARDYFREQQGNSLVYPKMITRYDYKVTARELGGEERQVISYGSWAPGQFEKEHHVVFPSTGTVEVLVLDGTNQPVADAKVQVNGKTIYTPANGLLTLPGTPFGWIGVQASKGVVGASGSGLLQSRSVPLRITLNLGSSAAIAGLVEAEEGIGQPSVGTRVVISVTSRLASTTRLETITDASGAYTFSGIPIGGTSVHFLFYGPDDTTIGAERVISIPDGTTGTYGIPKVKIDATPPRVLGVVPATNATDVSPSSPVIITFSEPIAASHLTSTNFQLVSTDDGAAVNATIVPVLKIDGTFDVKLVPPAPPAGQRFPLKSNVLYRVAVRNGILDTTGNALRAAFGSSFTTVNYTEPAVVRVLPAETQPLQSNETLRVKFNKAINVAALQGGTGGLVKVERLTTRGGVPDQTLSISISPDPADASTILVAPQGNGFEESKFYRLTVSDVRDTQDPPNVQKDAKVVDFFSYDTKKPIARLVSPVAAGEKLVSQIAYTVGVTVVDENTNDTPSTDVQYVDFFDGAGTWLTRDFNAPFTYDLHAPVTETGTTVTLKTSATDLSNNPGPQSDPMTWEIVPNAAPANVTVVNTPASAYASQPAQSVVTFTDEGIEVTAALKLVGTNVDGTPLEAILGSKLVTRASTTAPWPSATFNYTLPLELKSGTAQIVATVKDLGKTGTGQSPLEILVDDIQPEIVSYLPKAETRFAFNTPVTVELKVRDAQTGIKSAQRDIPGIDPSLIAETHTYDAATKVHTYRYTFNTPPKNADTRVTLRVTATDNRNNVTVASTDVIWERVDDENVPVAEWVTPLDGAILPTNLSNWQTTLRIRATDETKVTSVRFDSTALAAPVTVTLPKSGTTDIFETKAALNFPANGQPFVITATITDGDPGHDVVLPITIDPVTADAIVTQSTSVSSVTIGDYTNKTVVVRNIGNNTRLFVNIPLTVTNLIVLDGAIVSAFEETKLDLTVADRLFVDADSSIDVTDRGYLGGLRTVEAGGFTNTSRTGRTLGGTTAGGAINADGSHAGIGGFYLGTTNATYGSITDPTEFGSGSGASLTENRAGANGGGAVSIRTTGTGRMVVAGAIRANGGSAVSGGVWTAAAGGSIRLQAKTLITGWSSRITANGGDEGPSADEDLGGGGGRIAVRVADRFDADNITRLLQARGGRNGAEGGLAGGAGTVFLARPGSTNGELIVSAYDDRYPASTQRVHGTPLGGDLTFDAITIGPRAVARFDTAYTVPAPEAFKVDPTALVVAPGVVPQVSISTTPAAGADVAQSTSIKTFTTASSAAGIRDVRVVLSVQPTDVFTVPANWPTAISAYQSTILIPATATPGQTTLKVVVTDRAGRVTETAPVTFNITNNAAPAITKFDVVPATPIYANHAIAVDAAASDDVTVTDLSLASTVGTVTPTPSTITPAQSLSRQFSVFVPKTTPADTQVVLTLSATDGFPNRAATTQQKTVVVRKDEVMPEVAILKPAPNQIFDEATGAKFDLEVAAFDNEVAVQSVKATFEGQTYTLTAVPNRENVYAVSNIPLPAVDGVDPVAKTISIAVNDYTPNTNTVTHTIYVRPLVDPNAPKVSWACSSPNAMYPAGLTVPLRINAEGNTPSNGVSKVEFTINGNGPFLATETSSGSKVYNYNFAIPADAAAGTIFNVRASALSASGNEATLLGTFEIVSGSEFPTATVIEASNTSYDNRTLIIQNNGVVTIAGPHHFTAIVILSGGKLVQQPNANGSVDVLTFDRMYVACGGAVDMSEKGYARNTAYPGAATPLESSGGGHIGGGAIWGQYGGASYGSIHRPAELGGGGHSFDAAYPAYGGGVVRLAPVSKLIVDGAIRANGHDSTTWGPGAGGSVWITTPGAISGGGSIEVRGGGDSNNRGGAGGGAIALEYGSLSGAIVNNLITRGSTTNSGRPGASGSVYLKGPSSTYGDLIVDNRGYSSTAVTTLPRFGSWPVASVNGTSVTLGQRTVVPQYHVNNWVKVVAPDGTTRGTWRITSIANDPQSATVPNTFTFTSDAVTYDGFLLYAPGALGPAGRRIMAVRYNAGAWQYDADDNQPFVNFTPQPGDRLFASFRKNGSGVYEINNLTCGTTCGSVNGIQVAELTGGWIYGNTYGNTSTGTEVRSTATELSEFAFIGDPEGRGITITSLAPVITLEAGAVVQPGDSLRGVYRFDSVAVKGAAKVVATDAVESTSAPVLTTGGTFAPGDAAAPAVDLSKISITQGKNGPVVTGTAGAITDTDGVDVLLRNTAKPPVGFMPISDSSYMTQRIVNGVLQLHKIPNNNAGWGGVNSVPVGENAVARFRVGNPGILGGFGLGNNYFHFPNGGRWEVWVNGAWGNSGGKQGTLTASTRFRFEKTRDTLSWYVDDVLIHQASIAIAPTERFNFSFAYDGAWYDSVEFTSSNLGNAQITAAANGSFTIPINGAAGDVIVLTARSRHAYPQSTGELTLAPIPSDLGVASVTFTGDVTGGRSATGTVTMLRAAGADGSLVQLASSSTSAVVPATVTIAAGQSSATFTMTTLPVSAPVDVTITATWGGAATTGLVRIVKDNIAPTIAVVSPAANTQYSEGTGKIGVQANVTDQDSGVKRVFATLSGQTYELPKNTSKGATAYYADITAPFVDGTQPLTLDLAVTAVDNNDNSTVAPVVPVIINPVVDAALPTIEWRCSSTGAMYPVGYAARLRVYAKAPNTTNTLQKVEFTVTDPSGTPVVYQGGSLGNDLYEYMLTIPDVADGSLFTVTALATTVGGGDAVVIGNFTVLKGAMEIKSNTTIAANNTTYDNKSVVVWEGVTVTIDGVHPFDRLSVLVNGKVQHSDNSYFETTANALYVACGASIDASAHGYAQNTTYPNHSLPGFATGGSHMGYGSVYNDPIAQTFGSVQRPREAGGGGQRSSQGARGGGVLRITTGKLAVDGAVRANGGGAEDAGAGGSVWITATTLGGIGTIEARGGSGHRGGGGGAIAVEYTTATDTLLANVTAYGGSASNAPKSGGAGTIVIKPATLAYGELTIDNAALNGHPIELPALGSGTAQTGSAAATLITNRSADIPPYFAGHFVRITTASGTVKGTWAIATISAKTVTLKPNGSETIDVQPGDLWQGIYRFDSVRTRNTTLQSIDPIETTDYVVQSGTTVTSNVRATNLRVMSGAVLQHPAGGAMNLEVPGTLTIDSGAIIDGTGLGYGNNTTYPSHGLPGFATGGSHIGYGGLHDAPLAQTFGSVYRPMEAGGGGQRGGYGVAGGGVIRIQSGTLTNNGIIRANGAEYQDSGAGGSVWITTTTIGGSGSITVNGGNGHRSGGGGALAIEYANATGTVLNNLSAKGGSDNTAGGAGTIYLKSAASTYGNVTIDNGAIMGQPTALPSLGNGTAAAGTSGATLATGRSTAVPAYFVGHWVRVKDSAGAEKGVWRIASISGTSVTFAPNASETISLQQGDLWQGIYRFDDITTRNITLHSPDPIETLNRTVTGTIIADRVISTNLRISSGATLQHAAGSSLTLDVPGTLTIDAGGVIDVTGLGYPNNTSYPNHGLPGYATGGSHIGYGGLHDNPLAETFGSVYRPMEAGGGGQRGGYGVAGGGVIRLRAGTLLNNGAIRANGAEYQDSGAGGSIWITANTVGGSGTIEARGGSGHRAGGGGAIAIEYTNATGSLLSNLTAIGGPSGNPAGAGTIYLKTATSTFGDVIIDNAAQSGAATALPSFGKGIAQNGSSGTLLVTERTTNIPAYFAGHWVRITNAQGVVKGTWRVASVSGKNAVLEPNASESIVIAAGDSYQGIYRFDAVRMRNATLVSPDPIEGVDQTVEGSMTVLTPLVTSSLNIKPAATLRSAAGGVLEINVTNELKIDAGATIDVTGLGYGNNTTYPGHGLPGYATGGSHIGYGGLYDNPLGQVYGSIYRPMEAGGGGQRGGYGVAGGGVIRIRSGSLVHNGAIRANGAEYQDSGAGGSVWITTGPISGSGSITANGANGHRAGGGGAIAVEYTTASGTVLNNITATSGSGAVGGAGSIYRKSGTSVFGELTIDNGGLAGQSTLLPSFGSGSAANGSNGALVVTTRTTAIPAYFVGHWVEVTGSNGALKGTWRIASLAGTNNTNFMLEPNASESISIQPGDFWQGVFRFDNVKLRTTTVSTGDPLRVTGTIDKGTTTLDENAGPPIFAEAKRASIVVDSALAGDAVVGPFGTVLDSNAPVKLTITNVRTNATYTANANPDGSFRVPVAGRAGDTFTIYGTDSHSFPLTSPTYAVNGAIVELNTIQSFVIEPSTVASGSPAYAALRLAAPARSGGVIVTLTSSHAAANVPATVTIPAGQTSGQIAITTSSVSSATDVAITATVGASTKAANVTLLPSESAALIDVTLASASIEGGTTVNGTVLLGAPAPDGGALVTLTSTSTQATVTSSVVVPQGATQASFTVTTQKVGANTSLRINATWGASHSADLQLTPCASMGSVTAPSSTTLNSVWVDDAAPANATVTGDTSFDSTRVAFGASSLHFLPPTVNPVRTYAFTGATALTATPNDLLALWALVNPCNPPRQILVTWTDGTSSYRVSWGESRIDPTLPQINAGPIPTGGQWTRLDVLARALFSTNKSLTGLSIRVEGGEVWFDGVGVATCSLAPNAPSPSSFPANDVVWLDDDTPSGVTFGGTAWTWDTTQRASGSRSHVEPVAAGFHQHFFYSMPNPIAIAPGDVFYAYVFLDPCNPPREVMLQFSTGLGSGWDDRAYWGEDLIGGTRYRVGPLPELGKWVRLEVPAAVLRLNERKIDGLAFTLYDGRAWFDRSGKYGRVNLAYNKPARQSSDYTENDPPSRAVDGNLATGHGSMSITKYLADQWWEVDLGSVAPMIDSIEIRGRTDCCNSQTENITMIVSDDAITAANLTAARALTSSGASVYRFPGAANSSYTTQVGRSGRYIRIWRAGTDHLALPEVLVWAPASPGRVNVAAGKASFAPASHIYQSYLPQYANNGSASDTYNTTGNIFHSTTTTEPYWEVDLGKSEPVSTIDIGARTDCCPEQLTGYYVLTSDQPFAGTALATTLADPNVSAWYVGSFVPVANIHANRTARYVRVQRPGVNIGAIVFTEVRVWSQQPNTKLFSLPATPKPSTTSSSRSNTEFDFARAYRRQGLAPVAVAVR